jgi:hypothetical protein
VRRGRTARVNGACDQISYKPLLHSEWRPEGLFTSVFVVNSVDTLTQNMLKFVVGAGARRDSIKQKTAVTAFAAVFTVALGACGGSTHATGTARASVPHSAPTTVPRSVPTTPTTVALAEDAGSVAERMIRAGVPATVAFTYTAANDSNKLLGRQGGYSSKNSLQDRRLPKVNDWLSESVSSTDGGASLECYPLGQPAQAEQRYEYLKGFQGGLLGDGYDYVYGTCVLRLDKALLPDQADQYRAAFVAAVRGGQ